MPGTLSFEVLDVFTDTAFAGNPLAVVLGAERLNGGQMQALAREFHLSETAFPLEPTAAERARGVDYRLRIFTPQVELPFAGHPSIGAAWLMHALGRVGSGRVVQACGAGDLPLEVAPGGGQVELTGAAPTVTGRLDAEPLLSAVGLAATDLVGVAPAVAGCGIDFCYLPVRPGAVARSRFEAGLLEALPVGRGEVSGLCVVGWQKPQPVRMRVFAANIGVPEDPATGSAALGLGAFAVNAALLPGDGPSAFVIEQGIELGRPSTLRVRVEASGGAATSCRVSGDVVRVSAGTIAVPSPR